VRVTEKPAISDQSRAAAGRRGWSCVGCDLLNGQGCEIEADESIQAGFVTTDEDLRGRPFCQILWDRYPHWQETMTALLLAKQSSFGCVALADRADLPGQWFTFATAKKGGPRFFWLTSSVPLISELDERGPTDSLSAAPVQWQMQFGRPRAEPQLTNLINHWPGVVFNQRPDLSFQFVSNQIEEWTGVSVAEWQHESKRFQEVIHESDAGEWQQQLKRSVETTGGSSATFRIRHVKTGRVTYVQEHREALIDQKGLLLGYEGIWMNVSRQTIAAMRMVRASWMETLAGLTAGLAHDFSNAIAGVQAVSEALQTQVPKDHSFQEGLGLIKGGTHNAIKIVRRIISLHRSKVGERGYHDLNELVKEFIELARITVPRRIEIQVELISFPLPVYAEPVELRQIFFNLVLNAVEAMPERGKLTLRTTRCDQAPTAPNARGTLRNGPCVCLQVRDEGTGIPARHLEAIFDSCFTTKLENKGAGLGLYNALQLAGRNRGVLSVDSTENVGTTFYLWLPQSDFTEAERERQQPRGHRRTLLLIGPSGKCLDEMAASLRQQGHYVVPVPAGENPQELLASPNYEFSAVIALATSRETVPEQLFRQIRVRKLRIKTILQIGGCDWEEFTAPFLDSADLVIAAEIPTAEFLARVNAVIEGAGHPQP